MTRWICPTCGREQDEPFYCEGSDTKRHFVEAAVEDRAPMFCRALGREREKCAEAGYCRREYACNH